MRGLLTLLSALRTVFFLLDCLTQPQYEGFGLVLLYLILSCLLFASMWQVLYCRGNRGAVDLRQREGGKDLGGWGGGKTMVWIYCMSTFSLTEKRRRGKVKRRRRRRAHSSFNLDFNFIKFNLKFNSQMTNQFGG